jgi:RHS repeat-associated protein
VNRRITENPGTIRDLYYSMLWQLLEEDVGGSMADQYVWSPVYIDALIERDTPGQRMYADQDVNFNVTALVDTTGTVQERYDYDPFGAVTILAPDWTTRSSSNFGWVFFREGTRYDFATGFYLFHMRDYSPTLGRWLEDDQSGFGTSPSESNLYWYAGNNPTTRKDLNAGLKNGPIAGMLVQSDWGHGIGHVGLVVGSPETGYIIYSYGAHNQGTKEDNLYKKKFPTLEEALNWAKGDGYNAAQIFQITPIGMENIQIYVNKEGHKVYRFFRHNCLSIAAGGLAAAGVEVPEHTKYRKPSTYFDKLTGGEYVQLK